MPYSYLKRQCVDLSFTEVVGVMLDPSWRGVTGRHAWAVVDMVIPAVLQDRRLTLRFHK